MSEYQYYEFQAIDRPLDATARAALRDISSRARITAASFTNSYEWGDLKGDPLKMVERWFDLHLYVANWGSRRLIIRLPARLFDRAALARFTEEVDWVTLHDAGDMLIVDISKDETDDWKGRDDDENDEDEYSRGGSQSGDEEWDDGTSWLAALAPLRAELLAGDLRLFYLLWLTAVEANTFEPGTTEPMPGIGPITGALEAFVAFFRVDPDLAAAAAERDAQPRAVDSKPIIAAIPEQEKTSLLTRLVDGDPQIANELRALIRRRAAHTHLPPAPRTVAELRARATTLRKQREQAAAAKAEADRKLKQEQDAKAHRTRLDALARRGESVWRDVEAEIERRNASGYDKAATLLSDLKAVARQNSTTATFDQRLGAIRRRHATKRTFIERLQSLA